jgi:hypothetical protein
MKLYNCNKRIAKKYGVFRRNEKLSLAKELRVGGLVSTCNGGNSVIQDMYFEFRSIGKRSWVVTDIEIVTTDGHIHSWFHCCSLAETPKQIKEYYMGWDCEEGWKLIKEYKWDYMFRIFDALKNDSPICNSNGIIYPEFKPNYYSCK